ncbi:MAG: shikimate kinase [Salinibacter sp.]|uniref:shikimate kinase n=1 Tax=Salinibacter sp. TaxID=2065818 RepID=UPI0035D4A793
MRVYLTGFMASGKTTVGPKAAARLGQPFLDLDRLIRAHEGRSIPTIFAEDGEAAFRALETRALRRTADTDNLIVALGGGALVDKDNRAFAKRHGRILYLEVDAETVLDRVGDKADQRPLLQDEAGAPLPREKMKARIEQMMADRESSYAAAHATVDATQPVDAVVEAVVEAAREAEEDPTSGRA